MELRNWGKLFSYLVAMLYHFARLLMWVALRIFFRKIRLDNSELLIHDKPAILIANHQASFLDAIVLVVFLNRPIYYYVRGDIFENPIVYKIFTWLHMIPIYSIDNGREQLAKNKGTFDIGQDLLSQNKLLLIFPEGFSRLTKTVEPFKKGTARVALQSAFDSEFPIDLTIESVSINYSFHGFRSDLVIRVGETIELKKYEPEYRTLPNHALTRLTQEMYAVFQKNVLHVKQAERTLYVEALLRMLFTDVRYEAKLFFLKGTAICNHVSSLTGDDFSIAMANLNVYEKKLIQYGILDKEIAIKSSSFYLPLILLFLTSPFILIGFLVWAPIFKITKLIADKTVTRDDFYTSVFCGISGILGFLWWIVLCGIGLLIKVKLILGLLFISPLLYYFSLLWKEELKSILSGIKLKWLERNSNSVYAEIMASRKSIVFWN